MEGNFVAGWYEHPNLGLIKIFPVNDTWVYQCYTQNGSKAISGEKPLDQWTWVLSQEREDPSL